VYRLVNMLKFNKKLNNNQLIGASLVVLLIAVLGIHFLFSVHATGPYVSANPYGGTLTGGAVKQTCSAADNSDCVEFGISTSSSEGNITGVPAGITPGCGFESEFTGMSAAQQTSVISTMVSDNVHWLRLDVGGCNSNTFIADAEKAGINVDALLQDGGTNSDGSGTPTTPSAYAAYATQQVQTLKPLGVETYEVLNEPNGCEDTMPAATYVEILQAAYPAIKAADPKAFVLSAGLCPNGGSNEPYTYLTAMYAAGAHGYFDAFNLHPYSYPDTPDQTSDSWNPWSYLAQLHSIMSSNGDGSKQIWLTEFGCPSDGSSNDCTDQTEATQITDAFASARNISYIGPLMIFSWWDSSDGDYGLYNSSGVAKPDVLSDYQAASSTQ
jgi:hypothetical protein